MWVCMLLEGGKCQLLNGQIYVAQFQHFPPATAALATQRTCICVNDGTCCSTLFTRHTLDVSGCESRVNAARRVVADVGYHLVFVSVTRQSQTTVTRVTQLACMCVYWSLFAQNTSVLTHTRCQAVTPWRGQRWAQLGSTVASLCLINEVACLCVTCQRAIQRN